ncbi:hypothetical protein [Pilimelia columellifera]|uniref:Uncharacterized protein n=1 Tax=Pilimelia columellifera subsp. columellifera TaxID=706583 RepID=A0ABP6AP16_9ACTN
MTEERTVDESGQPAAGRARAGHVGWDPSEDGRSGVPGAGEVMEVNGYWPPSDGRPRNGNTRPVDNGRPLSTDPTRWCAPPPFGASSARSSHSTDSAARPSPSGAALNGSVVTPAPAAAVLVAPDGSAVVRPVLPHRVPASAEPATALAVPASPAQTPELARIATHLRRDEFPATPGERPEGFDVDAVLTAVRGVAGVQDASLRSTAAGAHNLRLDLAEGADAAHVSREVARLLQERLGLAAAPRSTLPRTAETGPPAQAWIPQQATPGRRPAHAAADTVTAVDTVVAADPVADAVGPVARVGADNAAATARAGTDERGRRGRRRANDDPEPPPVLVRPPAEDVAGRRQKSAWCADERPGRVLIEHVRVSSAGQEATVEVRLGVGPRTATGVATGPAVDSYILRLCAVAAASAIGDLVAEARPGSDPGRCFVEHVTTVTFGACEVAVVVVLLVCDGWVEQLAGSALVLGDPHHAAVRATMAAVNRLLDALL